MHVFWDVDFARIWIGFGRGFGKPKYSIFAFFSHVFRSKILNAIWKPKYFAPRGGGTPSSDQGGGPDPPTRVFLIYLKY